MSEKAKWVINDQIVFSACIQYRDKNYNFTKHAHSNVEIYYCFDGNCYMDIGLENIHVKSGECVMILPNIVHSFYLDNSNDCRFLHVHFDPNKLHDIHLRVNETQTINIFSFFNISKGYYRFKPHSQMLNDLSMIQESINCQTIFSQAFADMHLIKFLLHMVSEFQNKEDTKYLVSSKSPYVHQAVEYIKHYYKDKITLDSIADELNITARYLSKLFKEQMGITVLQYLNVYRINQSIVQMNSTKTLTEISQNVGLNDLQHYSKLFSRIIGINPRVYRRILDQHR